MAGASDYCQLIARCCQGIDGSMALERLTTQYGHPRRSRGDVGTIVNPPGDGLLERAQERKFRLSPAGA